MADSDHPRRFDPDRYYNPSDPEMRLFGTRQTLLRWRNDGYGPPYVRTGNRIRYLGRALNEWLDAQSGDPNPDK